MHLERMILPNLMIISTEFYMKSQKQNTVRKKKFWHWALIKNINNKSTQHHFFFEDVLITLLKQHKVDDHRLT